MMPIPLPGSNCLPDTGPQADSYTGSNDPFPEEEKLIKGIYEFCKKRPPPRISTTLDESDDHARNDYFILFHFFLFLLIVV